MMWFQNSSRAGGYDMTASPPRARQAIRTHVRMLRVGDPDHRAHEVSPTRGAAREGIAAPRVEVNKADR